MIVLVDYDNLLADKRDKGVRFLVESVLSTLEPSVLKGLSRVFFRLYGGWYDEAVLTKSAQVLTSEIQANFPSPISAIVGTTTYGMLAHVELALSLKSDPGNHLFRTYRTREIPSGIKAKRPGDLGCVEASCPLESVSNFVNAGRCSVATCSIKPIDLLFRAQQKLVDTMLTADVLYLSHNKASPIGVVTSDDDLWPGIRSAIGHGVRVLHVHTKPRARTRREYLTGVGANYFQTNIYG